ncbi:MAG: C-GCAxxG-C-C family (seleno)protein [candidate division KSB1 bacterium]|nr:C-GCAxxG-C-C family (seleno)protein [candidate division KSB1 bacterium]
MLNSKHRVSYLQTIRTFLKVGTCSETACLMINRGFDQSLIPEEQAAMPMAGGILQHGYQCGLLWGAALAAGARAYQLYGAGPEAETRAVLAAQQAVKNFRTCNKHKTIDCGDLTDLDETSSPVKLIQYFLLKGGVVSCLRMAGRYAPRAYTTINDSFAEHQMPVHPAPVSCTAVLCKKAGATEQQAVMASGLAGGIGLCGGGCGALGAAIWLLALRTNKTDQKMMFNSPEAQNIMNTFVKCTGAEFECSEIVGRKFEDIQDHAIYLQNGGCSQLLNALADDQESSY